MFHGRITQTVLRGLDFLSAHTLRPEDLAAHALTGRQGEEDAYFYLRRRGYVMVCRNFRSVHGRGEIDLIGWHEEVLCFIEVKTRTTLDVKPAEAAVDKEKWRQFIRGRARISAVARDRAAVAVRHFERLLRESPRRAAIPAFSKRPPVVR